MTLQVDTSDPTVMFVINPNSQGGRTEKHWDKYKKIIQDKFDNPWDFVIADQIGKGQELTEQAVNDGYKVIIGVGGEGTINEVLNGAYKTDPTTKIGFIRSGTSNDFLSSRVYDWPQKVEDQLAVIQRGNYWLAPMTKVEADYTRYSLNLADTGISAMVSYESSVKRRLNWIKGGLRYHILALLNVYKWKNIPATISVDDRELEGDLTMIVAGFSKQLGDYLMLPHADLAGDKMAYMVVRGYSRWKIVRMMNKFKKGKHDDDMEGIDMGFTSSIEITADRPPLFEVDGEPFSYDTTQITITAEPASVPIIAHSHVEEHYDVEINTMIPSPKSKTN